jgi:hypothetical protein
MHNPIPSMPSARPHVWSAPQAINDAEIGAARYRSHTDDRIWPFEPLDWFYINFLEAHYAAGLS